MFLIKKPVVTALSERNYYLGGIEAQNQNNNMRLWTWTSWWQRQINSLALCAWVLSRVLEK